jgi:hypothetical protein
MVKVMYKVYRVVEINGELVDCYWGSWNDKNKANEVALELRDSCFSTYVIEE